MLRLLLILPFVVVAAHAQPADPHFEWFEYEGRDAVFEQVEVEPDEYVNPILAGFYPDPSIVRAGDDYYLVTSSFSYYPGIPIFHSKDLVSWVQIGHVLDRPSQLGLDSLGISRGIFAPTIRYHDGTFYVICTLVDAGGNFLVTAADPAGPWSDPVWLPFDGIDPSMFFDEDGRVYVTNNGAPEGEPLYDGHRALWIQEYDPDAKAMVGPRRVIVDGGVDITQEPIWIEAPHIFKKDGTYYLIAAEGGTGYNHSEVVFRGEAPTGPYHPYENNPILTQRHLDPERPFPVTTAGHADFVELPNGDWWAVFLATRPYEGDLYNTGRETFMLPVTWTEDGWPIIVDGTEPIPYVVGRPNLRVQPRPGIQTSGDSDLPSGDSIPMSGNFTIREEFDSDEIAPYWTVIRTPREAWTSLDDGALVLAARDVSLAELGQPSFVGRRQQHLRATATTAMHYRPRESGDKAGLAAFQNRHYFYLMSVTLQDGRTVVQLERASGGEPEVIASAPVDATAPIYLRIDADGAEYDFSYSVEPDDWKTLHEAADGTILSTQKAGGFVGTMLGMAAYSKSR